MKFIPITFIPLMVQAILEDKKSVTRRILKPRTQEDFAIMINMEAGIEIEKQVQELIRCSSPYGQPGDVLWVRETWRPIEQDTGDPRYEYKATEKINLRDKWKPSIHMPKKACRLFLKVKSVKIERLHDVSPGSAVNEGIEYCNIDSEALSGGELIADYKNYMWRDDENYEDWFFPYYADPVSSFKSLWMMINKNWDANPWVWVIEFEQIEKPLNFPE